MKEETLDNFSLDDLKLIHCDRLCENQYITIIDLYLNLALDLHIDENNYITSLSIHYL